MRSRAELADCGEGPLTHGVQPEAAFSTLMTDLNSEGSILKRPCRGEDPRWIVSDGAGDARIRKRKGPRWNARAFGSPLPRLKLVECWAAYPSARAWGEKQQHRQEVTCASPQDKAVPEGVVEAKLTPLIKKYANGIADAARE
jgi:hypothetical protein